MAEPAPSARSQRLAAEPNVWLATTRPDGRPHLTPVWFVWVDDRMWIGTIRNAVKVRNIGINPRVSVALEDGNAPVTGEGTAEIAEVDAAPPRVHAAFAAKYGWDIADPAEPTVLLAIRVERWLHPGATTVT